MYVNIFWRMFLRADEGASLPLQVQSYRRGNSPFGGRTHAWVASTYDAQLCRGSSAALCRDANCICPTEALYFRLALDLYSRLALVLSFLCASFDLLSLGYFFPLLLRCIIANFSEKKKIKAGA